MLRRNFEHDVVHHAHVILKFLRLFYENIKRFILPRRDAFGNARDGIRRYIRCKKAQLRLLIILRVRIEQLHTGLVLQRSVGVQDITVVAD